MVWTQEKKSTANNRESLQKRSLLSEDLRKKPTANRRESRPSGSQNRICLSSLELGGSLASLTTCSAEVVRFQRPTRYRSAGSSLIGNVWANPVAAPAAPVRRK